RAHAFVRCLAGGPSPFRVRQQGNVTKASANALDRRLGDPMKHTAFATLGLIGLTTFAACSKDKTDDKPLETTQNDSSGAGNTTALPAAAANRPSQAGEAAFVTGVAAVRRANSEDKQVDDPSKPGKKVNNYITTLHRGEQVSVLKVDGDWAQVRSSDEKEGWI